MLKEKEICKNCKDELFFDKLQSCRCGFTSVDAQGAMYFYESGNVGYRKRKQVTPQG